MMLAELAKSKSIENGQSPFNHFEYTCSKIDHSIYLSILKGKMYTGIQLEQWESELDYVIKIMDYYKNLNYKVEYLHGGNLYIQW